jgi:hypothetical protein
MNTNIPKKKYKEIKLNFSKSLSGFPPKIYNNCIIIEDEDYDDNSNTPYNNDIFYIILIYLKKIRY